MAKSRQSKRDADVLQVQGDGLKFGISTTGINETLRALRRMEKDTYDALRKDIVDEAKPLAKAVGAAFPTTKPVERWHTTGRRGPSRLPGYSPANLSKAGKPVAAICHGPQLLISANSLNGRTLTCWPSIAIDVKNAGGLYVDKPVVEDGNLITSRKPDDVPAFSEAIMRALSGATES